MDSTPEGKERKSYFSMGTGIGIEDL